MRWLRFRVLRALRHRRREGQEWMGRHPRFARWLASMGCLHSDAYALARGVSIGLLIGLTPTVGLQILLMMIGCTLFRGNFLAAFAVSWISNPITMGPLYYGFHEIGQGLFAPLLTPLFELSGLSEGIGEESITAIIGSLVVAIPASISGYFLVLWGIRSRKDRIRRPRVSRPGSAGAGIIASAKTRSAMPPLG